MFAFEIDHIKINTLPFLKSVSLSPLSLVLSEQGPGMKITSNRAEEYLRHRHGNQKRQERAGEIAQQLRKLVGLPDFNFQQPHGGSQPSVMRLGALFCPALYA